MRFFAVVAFIPQQPAPAAPVVPAPPPSVFVVDTSTTGMTRNVVMGETGYAALARALDRALDSATNNWYSKKSGGAFAARLARFVWLDVFAAQYLFAWTHEYGHKTRANEAGLDARVVIGGTPWSLDAHTDIPLAGPTPSPGLYSAGIEATNVIARRVERRALTDDVAHDTDWTALFVAEGMAFGYIQKDLSAGKVSQGYSLQGPDYADPAGYVVTLLSRRLQRSPTLAERQALANEIRHNSWLNLVDYNLINVGSGLFVDHLWRGRSQTSVRWIHVAGGVSVIPSLRYELTPIGPERQVRSFVRAGRSTFLAYTRWADRADTGRLFGSGIDFVLPQHRSWRPSFAVDVWQNPDGSAAGRAEAGAEWIVPAHPRWLVTGALGAKQRGYLAGFADKAGGYVNIGAGVRF